MWDTNGSSVSPRRRVLLVLQDDLVPTHANAGGTIRFPVRLPRAQVFRLAILSGANGLEGGRDLSRGAAAKHCTIVSLGTAVVQTHDTRVCFGGPVEGTLEESRPCHRASAVPGAAAFIIIATTAGIAVPALPDGLGIQIKSGFIGTRPSEKKRRTHGADRPQGERHTLAHSDVRLSFTTRLRRASQQVCWRRRRW